MHKRENLGSQCENHPNLGATNYRALDDSLSALHAPTKFYAFAIALIVIFCAIGVFKNNNFIIFFWFISFFSSSIIIFRLIGALFIFGTYAKPNDYMVPQIAPIYSVLVALYKEASIAPTLVRNLEKINWPKEKLQIIFLIEEDDIETLNSIKSVKTSLDFEIIIIPQGRPKTKPRALQYGLQFVTGSFVCVYDAEDEPDPNQLLFAYKEFERKKGNLAVVQAPLVIWNKDESWISSQFALEYAIWFRLILPSFSLVSNLLPLGGTSNHFDVNILRKIGGWDAYNLTEDADLGVRIARYGYQSGIINCPTFEEAPPKISGWLNQRSRWIHGHLQTIAVHLKNPVLLYQQLGMRGIFVFILSLFSGPLSAIVRAPFLIFCTWEIINNSHPKSATILLLLGFVAEFLISYFAILIDGRKDLKIKILTLPFYWILQFPAAIKAMYNIFTRPFYWEKTKHGIEARKGGIWNLI